MRRYKQKDMDHVSNLRLIEGLSLGQIQKITNIPKTTIHKWVKAFHMTAEQQAKIKEESLKRLQEGRILAQRINHLKKKQKEEELFNKGKTEIGKLNKRDLFIAGVALYWAEGFKNKHEHRLGSRILGTNAPL